MRSFILLISCLLFSIVSCSAQARNGITLRTSYGVYLRPFSGSEEIARGFLPITIKNWNIPELSAEYTRWMKNKKWGWGFTFAMRKQGFTIDRNLYLPVSYTKILDEDILEYWSTTFGYGFHLKYRKGKYQFRTDVLINLDWLPRTTSGWRPTTPQNYPIYYELHDDVLGASWYYDYFKGPLGGIHETTLGFAIDRQLWKGLNASLGVQFQFVNKNEFNYEYRAEIFRNDEMPHKGTANNVTFVRRIEVLKLGLSYDLNWGDYEKKKKSKKSKE